MHRIHTAVPSATYTTPAQTPLGKLLATELRNGSTLTRMAVKYGVTPTGVRQIINRHSGTTVPDIIAARNLECRTILQANLKDLRPAAWEWSRRHPDAPLTDGVDQLDTTEELLRTVLGHRASFHKHRADTPSRQYSRDELAAHLARFHTETQQVSSPKFDDWSTSQGGPSRHTYFRLFGGWRNALVAASITDEPTRPQRGRKYTDDDLWAAVIDFLRTDPEWPSPQMYKRWSKLVGAPNHLRLLDRLQLPWSDIREKALQVIHNAPDVDPAWAAKVTRARDWGRMRAWAATPAEAVRHVNDYLTHCPDSLPSGLGYDKWAKRRRRPKLGTLTSGSGMTWRELVTACGREPARRGTKFSDADLIEAVAEFLRHTPGGNADAYGRWAKGAGKPCRATVALRLTWPTAAAAAAALNENSSLPDR